MDIALLLVEDCPHAHAAAALLRQALDDVGLTDVTFDTRTIRDAGQADDAHFVGSPTFLLAGHDPFNTAGATPALACRLYATPAGYSGLPTLEDLREALKQTADAESGSAHRGPASDANAATNSAQPTCGCCGRSGQRMHELGQTPGIYICIGCALWAARHAAGLDSAALKLPSQLTRQLRRIRSPHAH